MVQNMETRWVVDAKICRTKIWWDLNHCYVPASCVIILNPGVSPSLIKLHISTTLRHFGPTPLEPAPFRRIRRSKCCRGGLLRKDLQIFLILLMAEILHQLIGTVSHWIQCFIHPRWCRISSINSMIGVHSLCYIIPFTPKTDVWPSVRDLEPTILSCFVGGGSWCWRHFHIQTSYCNILTHAEWWIIIWWGPCMIGWSRAP